MDIVDNLTLALRVYNCIAFVVSWIVWPISLASFIVLGYRCFKKGNLRDALPLISTQLLSTIIWIFLATDQVGYFNEMTNGNRFLKGDFDDLRQLTIKFTLSSLIYLEPLNMFLYTWRFLSHLE